MVEHGCARFDFFNGFTLGQKDRVQPRTHHGGEILLQHAGGRAVGAHENTRRGFARSGNGIVLKAGKRYLVTAQLCTYASGDLNYLGYRLWDRYRLRALFSRTRISPQELAEWLTTGHAPLILDARSVLARDLDRRRIPGARIVDMESLDLVLPTIPRDRDVVVYCSCPNDASAVQVAWRLARIGHKRVRPLAGGFDAWSTAGHAVEADERP